MKVVKVIVFFMPLLCTTIAQNNAVKIPIFGPVIGAVEDAVEGAVHTAGDVIGEGEEVLTNRAGLVGGIITRALKRFQELMVESIPLLGLPKLEPLDIEQQIPIDIKHEIGIFKGTLDNVRVIGLSKFDIRSVKVKPLLPPYNVDLNLYFNDLTIVGDYVLDANVGDIFHIYGEGPFKMILHDLDTFVKITRLTVSKNLQNVQFEDLKLNITLGNLTSQLTNLMGGGDPEKVFNKVIEDMAPEAVQVLWPEISQIVEPKIKEILRFSLIPKKFRRFVDRFHINLSPITNLFGFNAHVHLKR